MSWRSHLSPILDNEHITHGLDDAEARLLIDWLIERAEEVDSDMRLRSLCRRARAIARFVALWSHERIFGAALQLAATERFAWPLPTEPMDAGDLMEQILAWENGANRRG